MVLCANMGNIQGLVLFSLKMIEYSYKVNLLFVGQLQISYDSTM